MSASQPQAKSNIPRACRHFVRSMAHRFLSSSMRSRLPTAEEHEEDYFDLLRDEDGPRASEPKYVPPPPQAATASSSRSSSSASALRENKPSVVVNPALLALPPLTGLALDIPASSTFVSPTNPRVGPSSPVSTATTNPVASVSGSTSSAPAPVARDDASTVTTPGTTAVPSARTPADDHSEPTCDAPSKLNTISLPVVVFSPAAPAREVTGAADATTLATAPTTPSELPCSFPPHSPAKPVDTLSTVPLRPSPPPNSTSPQPSSSKRKREETPVSQPDDTPEPKKVKKIPDIWKARPIRVTSALRIGSRRVRSPSPCEPPIPRARARAMAARAKADGEPSAPPTPSRRTKRLQNKEPAEEDTLPKPKVAPKRAKPSKRKRDEDEGDDSDYAGSPKEKRMKRKSTIEHDDLEDPSVSEQLSHEADIVQPLALRRTKRKTASPRKSGA